MNKWYLTVVAEDDFKFQVAGIFMGSKLCFGRRSSIRSFADKLNNVLRTKGGNYDVFVFPADGSLPVIFKHDDTWYTFRKRFREKVPFRAKHAYKILAIVVSAGDVRMIGDDD
jgi:hypothetical protein